MKRLLSLLLAALLVMSIVSVSALADAENPQIVIDGVKDADYTDARMLDSTWWQFWDEKHQAAEPLNPDRVKNTVWFTWDDDFVYLYFQAEGMFDLYQPSPEETTVPSRDEKFFEQANLYLDTNPSAEYYAPHQREDPANPDDDFCNHFYCNANAAGEDGEGESKYYRLMARCSPAWGAWHNYYRSDEGMFLTYEEFYQRRCVPTLEDGSVNAAYDERYVADPEGWYKKENGDAEAASFINYETKTYGFEVKYPRYDGEEYFQFNITNDVDSYDWPEEGPEPGYNMAFCQPAWMNFQELVEIYFEDWPIDDTDPTPPSVNAIRRMMGELPSDLKLIDGNHRTAVIELNAAYEKLSEEDAAFLTDDEKAFIVSAFEKIGLLDYVANLGDINGDGSKNANDALVALRAAVGKVELDEATTARADVNGDGTVSAKDALEILQFAVQKREKFTAEENLDI